MDWANVTPGELMDALREVRVLLCRFPRCESVGWSRPRHLDAEKNPTQSPETERRFPTASTPSQVDWNMRPRPLTEFFARFTPPKSQGKLTSRLKCNIYYYRANYFALLVLSFVVAFFRNPFALFACAMSCLSLLCANDSFAQSMSEKITRSVRKYHPPTAAWMRRNANVAA